MNHWCNVDVVENQGQHLWTETENRRSLLLLHLHFLHIHIHARRRYHLLLFHFHLCIHAVPLIILPILLLLLLLLQLILLLSSPEEPQAASFRCAERERRRSRVEFSLHHWCSCWYWCGETRCWDRHGQGIDSPLDVDVGQGG